MLFRGVIVLLILCACSSHAYAQRSVFATTLSAEQARAFFVDKTRVTFMPEHGSR